MLVRGGGGGQVLMETMCTPVIGKIEKIFALVIGKNKKNLDILPLKRINLKFLHRLQLKPKKITVQVYVPQKIRKIYFA